MDGKILFIYLQKKIIENGTDYRLNKKQKPSNDLHQTQFNWQPHHKRGFSICWILFSSFLIILSCSKVIDFKEPVDVLKKELPFIFLFNPNNNIIQFKSFSDYRTYLATDEKEVFFDSLAALRFRSLFDNIKNGYYKRKIVQTNTNLPYHDNWFENEDLSNLTKILNTDGIFSVDDYSFKIDDWGKFIYVARNKSIKTNKSIYFNLKGEIETKGEVYKFRTDYDILDMLEEAGLPIDGIEQQSIFCWNRGGADGGLAEPAIYFLDETWPASVISFSTNNPYGEPSSNSRVSVKLEYIRLAVFFQLSLKGKYDREDGSVAINGDPIFGGTTPWGTGEGNWNITFTEKHQGKCRKNKEEFHTGTISPPLNNENKARRVFWESDNGLHKYKLTATLNLNLKRAFRYLENESYHFLNNPSVEFFSIPTPRMVNSTEIFNFQPFEISDNY